MKTMHLRLMSQGYDELDTIELDEFAIAEDPEDAPYTGNEEILERVAALYTNVVELLAERQATPQRGLVWLKLALGEALLSADQRDGDVVLDIIVQPLRQGEDDELPVPTQD